MLPTMTPDDDKPWFAQDSAVDPMPALKAKARAEHAVFDARRQVLVEAYHNARTPKVRLKALAKIIRQHGEYAERGLFGDPAFAQFAAQVEKIAREL